MHNPTIALAEPARAFFRDLLLKIARERGGLTELLRAGRLRQGRHAKRSAPSYRGGSMTRQVQHRADRRGIRGPGGAPLMWRP